MSKNPSKMFQVAQQKPFGVTLVNGELPNTSPNQPPKFSESDMIQKSYGNFYRDGFFNRARPTVKLEVNEHTNTVWSDWNTNSSDLSKTVISSGFSANDLMRDGLRPFRNQMFPRRIFDQETQEEIGVLGNRPALRERK